jgi:hypothetical protein
MPQATGPPAAAETAASALPLLAHDASYFAASARIESWLRPQADRRRLRPKRN